MNKRVFGKRYKTVFKRTERLEGEGERVGAENETTTDRRGERRKV